MSNDSFSELLKNAHHDLQVRRKSRVDDSWWLTHKDVASKSGSYQWIAKLGVGEGVVEAINELSTVTEPAQFAFASFRRASHFGKTLPLDSYEVLHKLVADTEKTLIKLAADPSLILRFTKLKESIIGVMAQSLNVQHQSHQLRL